MLTEGRIEITLNNDVGESIYPLADLKSFISRGSEGIALSDIELIQTRDYAINIIQKLLRTSIISSEYKCYLYDFNNSTEPYFGKGIRLVKNYINNVSAIQYRKDNILNTLDATLYLLDKTTFKEAFVDILFPDSTSLQAVDTISNYYPKADSVVISFTAGLFANAGSIDAIIKSAISGYVVEKYNGCDENTLTSKIARDINPYFIPFANFLLF